MKMRGVILVMFIIGSFKVQAQSSIAASIEQANNLVDIEDYDQANKAFLALMHPDSLLPDELCYFFGKSLFHTGYVEQCEQLLTKYLNLTDTSGLHYDSAMVYMRLINGEDFGKAEPAVLSQNHESNEHPHNSSGEDPCQGNEFIVCPVCNGSGVIVSEGTFGNFYQACPYSDSHGRMPCRNYTEYLNGNLIEVKE